MCKSIYTGASIKRIASGNAPFASENMFPLVVLESGPPISFHWHSLIETVCKKESPPPA
jgi:hypothetical protein